MSSFLLILTAFSWLLLEQLLGLAVVCALINSYHADAPCASHSDGCKQFPGYFMQHGGGQCCKKSSRPRLGSQHLIHQLRDVTGLLTSLGLGPLTPITTGHCRTSLPPGVMATWENSCQMIRLVRAPPTLLVGM